MYYYKVINELNKSEIFFSKIRYSRRYILNEIYLKVDDEIKKNKEFFVNIKYELKKNKKLKLDNFSFIIEEFDVYSEDLIDELYNLLNT